MTIDDIFKFSGSNRVNIEGLIEDIKTQCVIPFIGAGLSAFAYPTWTKLLEKLSSGIDTDEIRNSIQDGINRGEYEKSADEIFKCLGEKGFFSRLRNIYGVALNDDKLDQLRQEAVYVLPFIFSGNMITTNYDIVLESVYKENKKLLRPAIPRNQAMINRTVQGTINGTLFKMHGDVESDNKDIIFTSESYEKNYCGETELVSSFTDFIISKKMLFLGCSLSTDRTMEVLKNVCLKRTALEHYAIIGCRREDLDNKKKELGENFNINAIVYPEGEHKAVRVILEHILKEIDPDQYEHLPFSIESLRKSTDPYAYDSNVTGLFGRDEEMQELEAFCNYSATRPLWWAITGEGGSGKSRLTYDFQIKMRNQGWRVFWEDHKDWNTFIHEVEKSPRETLIVIDYVMLHSERIGQWLSAISKTTNKWRILLIERDGTNFNDSNWVSLIERNSTSSSALKDTCYREEFLRLRVIGEKDIKMLMEEYAKYRNKKPNQETIDNLYNKLTDVDKDLKRPLYAMFIIDIWANDKKITKMDRNYLLDRIVSKEIKIIKNGVDAAEPLNKGKNRKIQNLCIDIKKMATMLGGLDLENLKYYCGQFEEIISRWLDSNGNYESIEEFLSDSSMDLEDSNKRIKPLLPDLVGEYFVLKELRKEPVKRKDDLKLVWKEPGAAFLFFDKLTDDFLGMTMEEDNLLDDILDATQENLSVENLRKFYSYLLRKLTVKQDLAGIEKTIDRLEALRKDYPEDSAVREAYALGLVFLSLRQDLAGREKTIDRLEALRKDYPEDSTVRGEYAMGLVSLSFEQDLAGIEKTIDRLEALRKDYPEDSAVREQYAKGLVNLTELQDLASILDSH